MKPTSIFTKILFGLFILQCISTKTYAFNPYQNLATINDPVNDPLYGLKNVYKDIYQSDPASSPELLWNFISGSTEMNLPALCFEKDDGSKVDTVFRIERVDGKMILSAVEGPYHILNGVTNLELETAHVSYVKFRVRSMSLVEGFEFTNAYDRSMSENVFEEDYLWDRLLLEHKKVFPQKDDIQVRTEHGVEHISFKNFHLRAKASSQLSHTLILDLSLHYGIISRPQSGFGKMVDSFWGLADPQIKLQSGYVCNINLDPSKTPGGIEKTK